MKKILVYVGPGFNKDESKKIVYSLLAHNIKITNIKSQATVVIVPNESQDSNATLCQEIYPYERIKDLIQKDLDFIKLKIKSESHEKTFSLNNVTKRFNVTRQNFKQRFLTRTTSK